MKADANRPTTPSRRTTAMVNESVPRILVVDDEADMRTLMTVVLSRAGYHVDTAQDGAVAWEAIRLKSYDLLITDYNMPNLTGVGLVRTLRAAGMALPVVMIAGILPAQELAQNPSLQFSAMLTKPFDHAELLGIITKVLRVDSREMQGA